MTKKRKISVRKLYYPYNNYRRALKTFKELAKKESLSITGIIENTKSSNYFKSAKILIERMIELDYCEEFGIISNKQNFCQNCNKSYRFLVRVRDLYPFYAWNPLKKYEKIETKPKKVTRINRLVWAQCHTCHHTFRTSKEIEYAVSQTRMIKLSENGRFAMLAFLKGNSLYDFISKHKELRYMDLIYALMNSQKKNEVNILLKKIRDNILSDPNVMPIVREWCSNMNEKVVQTRYHLELEQPLVMYKKRQRLGNSKFRK